MGGRFVLDCEDCKHYENGQCDLGREVDEYADAYDCTGFEDNGEGE